MLKQILYGDVPPTWRAAPLPLWKPEPEQRYCPECGSRRIMTTCVYYFGKDRNRATCQNCKFSLNVYDMWGIVGNKVDPWWSYTGKSTEEKDQQEDLENAARENWLFPIHPDEWEDFEINKVCIRIEERLILTEFPDPKTYCDDCGDWGFPKIQKYGDRQLCRTCLCVRKNFEGPEIEKPKYQHFVEVKFGENYDK